MSVPWEPVGGAGVTGHELGLTVGAGVTLWAALLVCIQVAEVALGIMAASLVSKLSPTSRVGPSYRLIAFGRLCTCNRTDAKQNAQAMQSVQNQLVDSKT